MNRLSESTHFHVCVFLLYCSSVCKISAAQSGSNKRSNLDGVASYCIRHFTVDLLLSLTEVFSLVVIEVVVVLLQFIELVY